MQSRKTPPASRTQHAYEQIRAQLLNGKLSARPLRAELGGPKVTTSDISVEHIRIESDKPYTEVRAALEKLVPRFDDPDFGISFGQPGRPNWWRKILSNIRAGMRRRSRLTCFATLPTG